MTKKKRKILDSDEEEFNPDEFSDEEEWIPSKNKNTIKTCTSTSRKPKVQTPSNKKPNTLGSLTEKKKEEKEKISTNVIPKKHEKESKIKSPKKQATLGDYFSKFSTTSYADVSTNKSPKSSIKLSIPLSKQSKPPEPSLPSEPQQSMPIDEKDIEYLLDYGYTKQDCIYALKKHPIGTPIEEVADWLCAYQLELEQEYSDSRSIQSSMPTKMSPTLSNKSKHISNIPISDTHNSNNNLISIPSETKSATKIHSSLISEKQHFPQITKVDDKNLSLSTPKKEINSNLSKNIHSPSKQKIADNKPKWKKFEKSLPSNPLSTEELPKGKNNCLAQLAFVITGDFDCISREKATDLIKQYGGVVRTGVTGKTDYLVAGTEPGPKKIETAKEKKIKIISLEELFEMIRTLKERSDEDVGTPKKQTPKKPATAPKLTGITHTPTISSTTITTNKSSSYPKTSMLWVDKYSPHLSKDLVGNPGCIKQLYDFLISWERKWITKEKIKVSEMKGKAALLSGPPGIGKTTAARIVAKECKYQIIEFNASDVRNKKALQNSISSVISSRSLSINLSNTESQLSRNVLIMDEVDGMSSGDRGGMAELIHLIKQSKIPIICICNDVSSQKIRSLKNITLDLRFRRPTSNQIIPRIQIIAQSEGISINHQTAEQIAQATHGDIRQLITLLQMWCRSTHSISFNEVKSQITSFSSKDIDLGPWQVMPMFFQRSSYTQKNWIDIQLNNFFTDYNIMPLFTFENYLSSYCDDLDCISSAADSICDGDIFNSFIYGSSDFSFLSHLAFSSCITPGYLLSPSGISQRFNFPSWLGKNSIQAKNKRLINELSSHLYGRTYADSNNIICDFLPYLRFFLTYPFILKSSVDSVSLILDQMDYYGITREDWDIIVSELDTFSKYKIISRINKESKAALTREWNKTGHFRVSDSCLKKKNFTFSENITLDDGKDNEPNLSSEESEPDDIDFKKNPMIKKKAVKNVKKKPIISKPSIQPSKKIKLSKPR